jgi:hypothetical protein
VHLKVAEPRDLHALALSKFSYHHFKKSINKVLGLPFVQAQLVKQSVSQLSLGQGCGIKRVKGEFHEEIITAKRDTICAIPVVTAITIRKSALVLA